MTDLCFTSDADSLIYAAIFFVVGCCGVWLIWLAKQPLPVVQPDRTELENDQPLVRVPSKAKEPPVFINTIGKD